MPALERLHALDHGTLILVRWSRTRRHVTEALKAQGELSDASIRLPGLEFARRQRSERRTPRGILVEPKEDIIARIGRSPDRGDAVVMALMATPKAGVRREAGVAAREGSWMG